jgi:hypothetical protein
MKFRFVSWNVNNRTLTVQHVDRLRQVDPDILAMQEVSARFYAAFSAANLFGWSTSSLMLRPPRGGEGRARRLGCAVFGRDPFRLEASALVPGLVFPERTVVAKIRWGSHRVTACSFHTPPGASWGVVKPQTLKAIAGWLAAESRPLVFGIDANAPKTDHPDISRSEWWWDEEPLFLGPALLHGLSDAFRLYLDAHPEVLDRIGLFSLGSPAVLEAALANAGFSNVTVQAVPTRRWYPSRAEALQDRKISCPEVGELMADLSDTEREVAWAEIEQAIGEFEGPNGVEVSGEVLVGAGTK